MRSLILRTASQIIIPLLLIFSIFLLMRGHNDPGGGFTGGLIAATAYVLYSIAFGPEAVRNALHWDPMLIAIFGLSCSVLAALVGPLTGQPVMKAIWFHVGGIHIGSPLLFDTGVYLVVVGAVLTIVLPMEEEAD